MGTIIPITVILLIFFYRRGYNDRKRKKFLKGQWGLNNRNKK
jgi:hypothetical protein|tara:strand:- start:121 stop:246 length:126 start_codon:yes stop_codon:yes gene_type:complete